MSEEGLERAKKKLLDAIREENHIKLEHHELSYSKERQYERAVEVNGEMMKARLKQLNALYDVKANTDDAHTRALLDGDIRTTRQEIDGSAERVKLYGNLLDETRRRNQQ